MLKKNNKKELIIGGIDVLDNNFEFASCILNEKNTWITTEYITNVLQKYCKKNFTPTSTHMNKFKEATVHNSYVERPKEYYIDGKNSKFIYHKDHTNHLNIIDNDKIKTTIPLQKTTYQRLELVGDGIIRASTGIYLYNRYNDMNEGEITIIRNKIEQGTNLSKLCKIIGLNKYIIMSRFMELNNNRETNDSLLEDVFESFIGAIAVTAGIDLCSQFITNIIMREINISELLYSNDNHKDKLLRYFHEQKWGNPDYCQLSKSNNTYVCGVIKMENEEKSIVISNGYGTTKKAAEQDAAKNALIKYNHNDDSDSDMEIDE